MQLSQEQTAAAFTESKNALCLAGAGSGKTRVLISRINNLVENCQVSPYEIMAVTFTRKSAGEMRERLEKSIGNKAFNVTIGTLHSVALNYVQRFGEFIGLNPGKITVYSQWEEGILLKDVCKELGYHNGKTFRKVKKKDIDEAFHLFYTRKRRNDHMYTENEIMDAFFQRCKENNALTYGMIMTSFLDLIPRIGHMLKFRHILVDEVQDNDPLQWRIINLITSICDASLFVVGDDSQCQPAGTMVETIKGWKPIEKLDPEKDELYTYEKHDAMIYGGRNRGYKFKKASRPFSGNMYKVSANGTSTKCTPNHKWWVKWSDLGRDPKWNVVYLMRQGNRFRIGWCQMFQSYPERGGNTFHLWQRARLEKADAVWVLRVFDNKKDASLWESILSTQYAIPTITFEERETTCYYDRSGIDMVFDKLGNLTRKAEDIIDDHGLEMKYPFHSIERNNQKRGGSRVFEIEACNMISEFFSVPHRRGGGRYIDWSVAGITSEWVSNVTVYSLDVEKNHTYIADGLCTKNSIYGFRGADPEYLIRNQEKFDIYKLKDNYRSDAYIVDAANKLIKHNENRLDLEMNAIRCPAAQVSEFKNIDSNGIVNLINDIKFYKLDSMNHESAILARNHYLLEKLSTLLESAGIDHEYIGKKTGFTRSEEFRRVHAFLVLAVNPFDNFSFLLCRDYLGISMYDYKAIRMQAVQQDKSHFQVFREMNQPEWITEYLNAIDKESFVDVVEFIEMIDFGFEDVPVLEFIQEYIEANHQPTIHQYLEYVTLYDVQDELIEDPCKLQLMTIHASKGLEWSMVIIAGLNEGILPSYRAKNSQSELESERRLAYVAYTRAKDFLILTSRPVDPEAKVQQPPSQFIKETF